MIKNLFLLISLLAFMSIGIPAVETSAQTGQPSTGSGTNASKKAEPVSGTVLETMNNGGYSYIRLQKKNGDKIWVAVMETQVKVGSQMSFNPGIVMSNFESKGLKRTFDKIIFSDGQVKPAVAVTNSGLKKMPAASPGSKGAVTGKEKKISVKKATGANAITVEEAFKNSAKLDKKTVVVRGKVVKVSSGIMNKNWIHIQDGTGAEATGTHDLVCTSKDMAAMGDIVTVSGTLAKDRDFGSGYRYNAIIENARFKK